MTKAEQNIYDKRDDFNFHHLNFSFLSSNIPAVPAYGVYYIYTLYISQLMRYSRLCGSYTDCFYRGLLLNKEATEGFLVVKLQQSHRKSCDHHHDLANRYEISLSQMTPHIYISFVVITIQFYRHVWLITGFVIRVNGLMCNCLSFRNTQVRPLFLEGWELLDLLFSV